VPDGAARLDLQSVRNQYQLTGIKNIEAQTLNGHLVQKIYFQPDVNLGLAISQVVAGRMQSAPSCRRASSPDRGAIQCSSVPVCSSASSSDRLNEQQLYDYGYYNLRQQLARLPGVTSRHQTVQVPADHVDIDPSSFPGEGAHPDGRGERGQCPEPHLPSGLAKIGDKQYTVRTNAMPVSIADLNDIPIKFINGQTVFVQGCRPVHDGWGVQQNVVRQDGRRSVLLSVLKNGNASTVAVVKRSPQGPEDGPRAAPPGLGIHELFDQSKLVTASIAGVLREGAIAAGLTG